LLYLTCPPVRKFGYSHIKSLPKDTLTVLNASDTPNVPVDSIKQDSLVRKDSSVSRDSTVKNSLENIASTDTNANVNPQKPSSKSYAYNESIVNESNTKERYKIHIKNEIIYGKTRIIIQGDSGKIIDSIIKGYDSVYTKDSVFEDSL